MTNKEFKSLSPEEKKSKFKAVLKTKTNNRLTEEEIRSVLLMVSPKLQYNVFVYADADEFTSKLTVKKPQVGRTVFGHVLVGTAELPGRLFSTDRAAAIMLRTAGDEATRQLHIFIPPHNLRKDNISNEQQRTSKKNRQ